MRRGVLVTAALTTIATACGGDDGGSGETASDRPVVIATTGIWADIVDNIACGDVDVVTLIGDGADAHSFEPSLADRSLLGAAALIVANGLGLEAGLDETIADVEAEGTPVLRVGDHVEALDGDPHLWLDPQRVGRAIPAIGARLVDDVGLDAAAVDTCGQRYREDLLVVDTEVAATLESVPSERRVLVTNHDSLGYFAARYGFEVLGTVLSGSSTLAETSPSALEALARDIERTGVTAVFAQTGQDTRDAEALARRVDVELVSLPGAALGSDGSDTDTYLGVLRSQGDLIANALG